MAHKTIIMEIRECIEKQLDMGRKEFIIYPYGDIGMQVRNILSEVYALEPKLIVDNKLANYNNNIKTLSYVKEHYHGETVILASLNLDIYDQLKSNLLSFIKEEAIAELEQMRNYKIKEEFHWKTEIGRYSYGPICRNHEMIEKIGNFCSFADGVDAVQNHPMDYLTTHQMLYAGKVFGDYEVEYSTYSTEKWYFQGVQSHRAFDGRKRTIIGNDVWLGRNVTITNGANIGNGVIAGAGAIITKDVPDFAIVTGIPARIVRYRYDKNQIEALNKIAWWDWSDDEIRERYDDLYLPVDSFIKKYI